MEISLSQLIQLKKRLQDEVYMARNEFLRGEYTETTADVVTDSVSKEEFVESHNKLLKLHDLHLQVGLLITQLNAQVKVKDGDREMPIQQAISHAKFLRDYAAVFKSLGSQKKISIGSTGGGLRQGEKVVVERNHDIKGMLKDSKSLFLQADRLSREIEAASVTTIIDTNDLAELEGIEEYL